ncbi:MAG: cobalamin B12-binding domain-containing protein, partial [Candidatus Omnitrophica bacterium]|nr:cobalamin B12-binding domain-containing protein [Candidatus Omnitrophota bacterium]
MVPILPAVSLIIPPSIFLLDERVFMNLGILKVAAVLEKAGYPLEVLDFSGIENYEEALLDHCSSTGSRIFGITSTTPQMPAAYKMAHVIRRALPMARLILGGPHATLVHTAYAREIKDNNPGRAAKAIQSLEEIFDVIVSGDGEQAIFEALRNDPPKLVDANSRQSAL